MNRRDLLQLLRGLLASGALESMGASAATLSLARSITANAQEPPAPPNPTPPPAISGSSSAGPTPEPPPTPTPTLDDPDESSFEGLQATMSNAVGQITDAINADTHTHAAMPAKGSPLDLSAIGGVTFSAGFSVNTDAYGGTTSWGVGVAVSFNPATLDYGSEVYTTTGTGKSTSADPGSSASAVVSIGSGDLSGFNGPSKTTSGALSGGTTSVSTNETFASVGAGVSTSEGLSTETSTTTAYPGTESHGNAGQDVGRITKSIGTSMNAVMGLGDTIMNLIP